MSSCEQTSGHTAEPDEAQIPSCIVEFRLEHPANRPSRNPDHLGASQRLDTFESIRFENAGDGDAYVICSGNGSDCQGARVKVDRRDLTKFQVPETTAKLGMLCTADIWYQRTGNLLQQYELEGS